MIVLGIMWHPLFLTLEPMSLGCHSWIIWLILLVASGRLLLQISEAVQLYQQDAGTRLEAAFRSGRSSVPLAGLSPELEGAIATWKKVLNHATDDRD